MRRHLFAKPAVAALGLTLAIAAVSAGARASDADGDADADGDRPDLPLDRELAGIEPGRILSHIRVLASDELEGGGPGTEGEQKTVAYLTDQFRGMGLKPGNPDGTYVQDVPLVGFRATKVVGSFSTRGGPSPLAFPEDLVAISRRMEGSTRVEGTEVVFVGHGVVAPEYGWDDYKGLDVRGKTLLMLVNDPPVADPKDPAQLDSSVFQGRAMTYHGRWTYKYEIASEKGAAAAILIHETGPAGYPFEVVRGSWSRENLDIAREKPADAAAGQAPDRVAVEGWIDEARARELLRASGQDLDALRKSAATRESRPVPLGSTARFEITNTLREVKARNVIARLEGSEPKLKDESVVYTAHRADPARGYYFRSDHFEFARKGVPALDPKGGRQYAGKWADFGKPKQDEYTANENHRPSDEVKPDWDLAGAAADARLLVELGYAVAQGPKSPEWKPDSGFRARRGAMLEAGKP